MAKRKKGTATSPPTRKRQKRQEHPHGNIEPDVEYKLKSIIDENATQYLISWEDNEVTGESYANSWEPKRNANEAAIEDWKKQKEKQRKELKSRATATPSKKRGRPRKVIISSPVPEDPPLANRSEISAEPEIGESQNSDISPPKAHPQPGTSPNRHGLQDSRPRARDLSPLFEPESSPAASPISLTVVGVPVINSDPPSSYVAYGSQTFSQNASSSSAPVAKDSLPEPSQYVPDPADTTTTTIDETTDISLVHTTQSQPSQPAPNNTATSEFVVDSQPPDGSLSFVPSTAATKSSASDPQTQTQSGAQSQPPQTDLDVSSVAQDTQGRTEDEVAPSEELVGTQGPNESQTSHHSSHEPANSGPQHSAQPSPEVQTVGQAQQSDQAAEQDPVNLISTSVEVPTTFPITPPTRRTFDQHSQFSQRPVPGSSAWLSSCKAAETASQAQAAFSPVRDSQTTQFPAVESQEASLSGQTSPPKPLTPYADLPVDSIEIGSLGGTFPPPLSTFTPSAQLTPKSRAMDTSRSTPRSGQSLREKMDALNAQFGRANRGQASTLSPATPSIHEPAAAVPEAAVSAAAVASRALAALPTANPERLMSPTVERLASPALLGRSARSPSAVPAVAPRPVITRDEMNTSERYETLLPQAGDLGSVGETRKPSIVAPGQRETGDVDRETMYTIPIGLFGHQRDQYPSLVYFYRKAVQDFLKTAHPDDALIKKIQHFVQRARHIAMHPDLDTVGTLTQHDDVSSSQQAEWDTKCSAKFRFLQELIDRLRDQPIHIAILSSPGNIVRMLDTFLQGLGFDSPTAMAEGKESTDFGGKLAVTLWSTEDEPASVSPADIVIAMDNPARHDSITVKALRQKDGRWSPFVTLVVPYTVEHVERCLSYKLSDGVLARALVSGIYSLHTDAGKLEEGDLPAKESAEALARFLVSKDDGKKWPLSALSMLEDIDSQTESEIELPTENGTPSKRSYEQVDSSGRPAKKARFVSSAVVEGNDIYQVDDSMDLEDGPVNAFGHPADVVPPASTEIEERLQQLLKEKDDRLDQFEHDMAGLQFRFEEQRKAMAEVVTERDAAIDTAQQAVARLSEQSSLRPKMKELEQQLKEANDRLIDHSVPERAQFEALRLAAEELKKGKEKAETTLERTKNELTYARDLYRDTSNAASSLGTENTDLQNQLAVAQNRATGEQARVKQMALDAVTAKTQQENAMLKAMLQDREAGLKFRDEEIAKLKEASRGRMGTRGTSVPRSPRLGSPMKSRQGSPAPGEMRGRGSLLRNA